MSEKGLFGTVTDLIPTMRAPPRLSVRQSLFTQCASAINAWPAQMKKPAYAGFFPRIPGGRATPTPRVSC